MYYPFTGIVIHGDGRGRQIGFPTANLSVEKHILLPARGVYAVRVEWRGDYYDGMMNVGLRPTFKDDEELTILPEVHLLDFSKDIYDQELTVHVIKHLRDEKKFDGKDALVEQLEKDKEATRKVLEEEKDQ